MLWGCISFKGPWEIAVITLTIKVFVYIEFLDNSIDKNWFDDNEIIFQGDSAFCHKAKEIQFFFSGKDYKINNMVSEQSGSKS